jgi:hypothetical protein
MDPLVAGREQTGHHHRARTRLLWEENAIETGSNFDALPIARDVDAFDPPRGVWEQFRHGSIAEQV